MALLVSSNSWANKLLVQITRANVTKLKNVSCLITLPLPGGYPTDPLVNICAFTCTLYVCTYTSIHSTCWLHAHICHMLPYDLGIATWYYEIEQEKRSPAGIRWCIPVENLATGCHNVWHVRQCCVVVKQHVEQDDHHTMSAGCNRPGSYLHVRVGRQWQETQSQGHIFPWKRCGPILEGSKYDTDIKEQKKDRPPKSQKKSRCRRKVEWRIRMYIYTYIHNSYTVIMHKLLSGLSFGREYFQLWPVTWWSMRGEGLNGA